MILRARWPIIHGVRGGWKATTALVQLISCQNPCTLPWWPSTPFMPVIWQKQMAFSCMSTICQENRDRPKRYGDSACLTDLSICVRRTQWAALPRTGKTNKTSKNQKLFCRFADDFIYMSIFTYRLLRFRFTTIVLVLAPETYTFGFFLSDRKSVV